MYYTSKEVYEYISKQRNDPIVEWKTCAVSGAEFPIYKSDLEFYDKVSPVINGVKYKIPTPKLCPEERERRRMSWRNERSLYRSTCDATGRQIISMYPDNSWYTVYDRKIRYSDQWDAMDYGRAYDFSKTFFQNFEALNRAVPKKSLHLVPNLENCEYCNYGIFSKSCYLVNGWGWSENCLYTIIPLRSKYDVDGGFNTDCQHCYQCIHCIGCFKCRYADHSNRCQNSAFLSFCNDCEYCLWCVNLSNAKYCILNKQYSKEEYEEIVSTILQHRDHIAEFREKFEALVFSSPKKNVNNVTTEWCFANYVQDGKDHVLCSLVYEWTGNKYSSYTGMSKEDPIYDGYATTQSWFTLETCGLTWRKSAFILTGEFHVNDCYYCQHVGSCDNCFGCIGIKNKQYCILNKQYTKEEYGELLPKIIEQMKKDWEWWEFFPTKFSTFWYNETIANVFYPLKKEEALVRWYKWQSQEHFPNIPQGMNTIQGNTLPPTIETVTDDITQKIILCEETWKPFRIIKQELDFYRKHNIPLPTKHQDVRQKELLTKRMPKSFYLTHCAKCNQEILTVYNPEIWLNVYCESCYNKEIYW